MLRVIFGLLPERQALSACASTCRNWRAAAASLHCDVWAVPGACEQPLHPGQLVSLAPGPPTASTSPSGMWLCTVTRSAGAFHAVFQRPDGGTTSLFYAEERRGGIDIHLIRPSKRLPGDAPLATLERSYWGTAYTMHSTPASRHLASLVSSDTPSAASVPEAAVINIGYSCRLAALLHPRKLQVTLPGGGAPPAAMPPSRPEHQRRKVSPCGPAREPAPSLAAAACTVVVSSSSSSVAAPPQDTTHPAGTLKLVNRQPHWNASVRAWVLNFQGRVKQPSVKNFQLVAAATPAAEEMVMQFGKVDSDTFAMDFNPQRITALQTFAVALSTFTRRVAF